MKDTFYFPHDYNARGDEKIVSLLRKHGLEGYGAYWFLIEKLYESGGRIAADFDAIAYDLRAKTETVKSVATKFELFYLTGSPRLLASKSVDRRLQERRERSQKASQSGKLGVVAKQSLLNKQADAQQPLSDRQADAQLERKERKEVKKEITTATPSAVDLLIGSIKTDIPKAYDAWRFPKGFNAKYAGAYLLNVPVDECEKLLNTPRLGLEIKDALEWRITQKKMECAK